MISSTARSRTLSPEESGWLRPTVLTSLYTVSLIQHVSFHNKMQTSVTPTSPYWPNSHERSKREHVEPDYFHIQRSAQIVCFNKTRAGDGLNLWCLWIVFYDDKITVNYWSLVRDQLSLVKQKGFYSLIEKFFVATLSLMILRQWELGRSTNCEQGELLGCSKWSSSGAFQFWGVWGAEEGDELKSC